MIIDNLSVINLRKIKIFAESFCRNTNVITGKNGSGKTSILEAIFFISHAKSFRKKYSQALISNNQKELQIKIETDRSTVKGFYNKKRKVFYKNSEIIKKTSQLSEEILIVCMSPEEIDIIEEYNNEKQKYFDRIIFKIKKEHIKNIKDYKKLIVYRNTLLENKMETDPWDNKIMELGNKIWKIRKDFFKYFIKKYKEVEKKIEIKNRYEIKYISSVLEKQKYLIELRKKNKSNKTEVGPHKDKIKFFINGSEVKEHASQGEKKIFKYFLKLTEAEILKKEKRTNPIVLIDDFFAKLDGENIMKIFSYFHCKFQTIITTTNTDNKILEKLKNKQTKIFTFND